MIELIIINSLIIWGVYASLQEGFIFEELGNLIRGYYYEENERHNPEKVDNYWIFKKWVQKPLATCPVCMSSVYGTPVFWLSYYIELINFDFIIIVYICYIFALAGLNYLILTFMPEGSSDKKEYLRVELNEADSYMNNIGAELNNYAEQGWKINHILKSDEKELEYGNCHHITYILERDK